MAEVVDRQHEATAGQRGGDMTQPAGGNLPRLIPTERILNAAIIIADNEPKYEIGEEWEFGFSCGWKMALMQMMAEIMEPTERGEPQ